MLMACGEAWGRQLFRIFSIVSVVALRKTGWELSSLS